MANALLSQFIISNNKEVLDIIKKCIFSAYSPFSMEINTYLDTNRLLIAAKNRKIKLPEIDYKKMQSIILEEDNCNYISCIKLSQIVSKWRLDVFYNDELLILISKAFPNVKFTVHECYEENDDVYVLLDGEKVITYYEHDDGEIISRYVRYRNKNKKIISRLIEQIKYEIDEDGCYEYYKVFGGKKENNKHYRNYEEIIPPFEFLLNRDQITKFINKKTDKQIKDLAPMLQLKIASANTTDPWEIVQIIREYFKNGH